MVACGVGVSVPTGNTAGGRLGSYPVWAQWDHEIDLEQAEVKARRDWWRNQGNENNAQKKCKKRCRCLRACLLQLSHLKFCSFFPVPAAQDSNQGSGSQPVWTSCSASCLPSNLPVTDVADRTLLDNQIATSLLSSPKWYHSYAINILSRHCLMHFNLVIVECLKPWKNNMEILIFCIISITFIL